MNSPLDAEPTPPGTIMTHMLEEEAEIRRQNKVRWRWVNSLFVLGLVAMNLFIFDVPQGWRKIWFGLATISIVVGTYWAIRHYRDVRASNEKAT